MDMTRLNLTQADPILERECVVCLNMSPYPLRSGVCSICIEEKIEKFDYCRKCGRKLVKGECRICKRYKSKKKQSLWEQRRSALLMDEYPTETCSVDKIKGISRRDKYISISWRNLSEEDKKLIQDYYPLSKSSKQRSILEHRLIAAIARKKALNKNEIVHHKNGVWTDNRINNLEVTYRSAHKVVHADLARIEKRLIGQNEQLKEILGRLQNAM